MNLPADPAAEDRAHAADHKTGKHICAQRLRRPPKNIARDAGRAEDAEFYHAVKVVKTRRRVEARFSSRLRPLRVL